MEQEKEEFVETVRPKGSGVGEDFGQMFEESLRSVKPGEIVRGRVVEIGPEFITVDIGYKSEGRIPVNEFRQRDGRLAVSEGDEIEVYFDAAIPNRKALSYPVPRQSSTASGTRSRRPAFIRAQ